MLRREGNSWRAASQRVLWGSRTGENPQATKFSLTQASTHLKIMRKVTWLWPNQLLVNSLEWTKLIQYHSVTWQTSFPSRWKMCSYFFVVLVISDRRNRKQRSWIKVRILRTHYLNMRVIQTNKYKLCKCLNVYNTQDTLSIKDNYLEWFNQL